MGDRVSMGVVAVIGGAHETSGASALGHCNISPIEVKYQWCYDTAYYRAVIDRYYRQVPFVLRLSTQFTLLWIVVVAVSWGTFGIALAELILWALPSGALGVPALVILTRKAIFLKYRVRSSFGTEVCYSLSDSGGRIQQFAGESEFPWSTYTRAVRFSDGLLLLRRGAIRWLPDQSLVSGSMDDVLMLVRAKLPMRVIQ